jgi:hypothetical protein
LLSASGNYLTAIFLARAAWSWYVAGVPEFQAAVRSRPDLSQAVRFFRGARMTLTKVMEQRGNVGSSVNSDAARQIGGPKGDFHPAQVRQRRMN